MTDSTIKSIKKDFFIFRNGVVADSVRKLYEPTTIIFGLMVPQFIELANKYPKNIDLALQLWNDKNCRESRLLALYLLPVNELQKEKAKEMILGINSREQAEFLSFKILRNLQYAPVLLDELKKEISLNRLVSYCSEMLEKNLNAGK